VPKDGNLEGLFVNRTEGLPRLLKAGPGSSIRAVIKRLGATRKLLPWKYLSAIASLIKNACESILKWCRLAYTLPIQGIRIMR
jgi:hypothetical protein